MKFIEFIISTSKFKNGYYGELLSRSLENITTKVDNNAMGLHITSQCAREGFDWAQKLTRPKRVFSGRELPWEQRFIVSFRRVRQGHVSDFEKNCWVI